MVPPVDAEERKPWHRRRQADAAAAVEEAAAGAGAVLP
jgi:hypothetical protein